MALLEDLWETISSDATEKNATYRCIDCLAEYDESKRLCPKCGCEKFERV